MDPFTIAAIGKGLYGAYVSARQNSKANSLERGLVRPVYKTPEEIRMNLINAQKKRARASLYGLPGEGVIQNRIEGNAAAGNAAAINAGQDSSSILATIAANTTGAGNATEKLGVDSVNYQAQQIDTADAGVSNALGISAQYKDKEFQYNQDDPYKARVAAISALRGASGQNLNTAIDTGLKALGAIGQGGGGNKMPGTPGLSTTATVPGAMTDGNNTGPIVAPNPTVGATNNSDSLIDMLQRQHPQFSREQIKSMYGGLIK